MDKEEYNKTKKSIEIKKNKINKIKKIKKTRQNNKIRI